MKNAKLCLAALAAFPLTSTLHPQVPQLFNYQRCVAVDGVKFDGSGQFEFALVSSAGTATYWSDGGTSVGA